MSFNFAQSVSCVTLNTFRVTKITQKQLLVMCLFVIYCPGTSLYIQSIPSSHLVYLETETFLKIFALGFLLSSSPFTIQVTA